MYFQASFELISGAISQGKSLDALDHVILAGALGASMIGFSGRCASPI